jgi:hypothetical protein
VPSGRLVYTRENVTSEVVLEWAPPTSINLTVRREGNSVTTSFAVAPETNTWTSPNGELFRAMREAILSLYPEVKPTTAH